MGWHVLYTGNTAPACFLRKDIDASHGEVPEDPLGIFQRPDLRDCVHALPRLRRCRAKDSRFVSLSIDFYEIAASHYVGHSRGADHEPIQIPIWVNFRSR